MQAAGSDAELARHIAETGGAEAEAELYRRVAARIELYGRRHLGTPAAAQDLVQQVILRVLEALRAGRLENPAALASFVLGTCSNVCWDTQRAEQRKRRLEQESLALAPPAVTLPVIEERDVVRLFDCMGKLPAREATRSIWAATASRPRQRPALEARRRPARMIHPARGISPPSPPGAAKFLSARMDSASSRARRAQRRTRPDRADSRT